MSTRAILVSGLMLAAFITASNPTISGEHRTMPSGELFSLWGGGDVPNSCCINIMNCNGTDGVCGNVPIMMCNNQSVRTFYAGNKKSCLGFMMSQTCTESGSHTCAEDFQCQIDPDDNTKCVRRSPDAVNTYTSPDSCSPAC